jgi:hypothetical protein
VGLQVAGDISEGRFAYQIGVFNGVPEVAGDREPENTLITRFQTSF